MKHEYLNQTEEPWYNWRTLAGYIYLTICLFDFVLMPAIIQINHADTKEILIDLMSGEPDKQFVLAIFDRTTSDNWSPLTLVGGGLFHISFGAILTGAAVSRGRERTEMVKNGNSRKNR